MDRDESLYFDEFSKKTLHEIREMFKHLKAIGLSDKDIEHYAVEYKKYFENLESIKNTINTMKK